MRWYAVKLFFSVIEMHSFPVIFPYTTFSSLERIVKNIDLVKKIPYDEEFLKIVNIVKEKVSRGDWGPMSHGDR